jgi:uncharacterized repeat protein (TIGR01451 family)
MKPLIKKMISITQLLKSMRRISLLKILTTCLFSAVFALPMAANAHGVGFVNGRIQMDPASIAAQMSKAVPGVASGENISYIIQADADSTTGATGYFTFYPQTGTTVTNAEFVNSAFTRISATAPSSMPDGYGPRGTRTFTNWTATAGMSSLSVLHGDTGVFYSTSPVTQLFNPNANGSITTNVLGATIRTTSQLENVTATHNMWDANQTRAFGAGSANEAANTPSTAPVVNTNGSGTTPFQSGSPVAGSDVGYSLDNTGFTGPWRRISYPGSYGTLGLPAVNTAAAVAGALAVSGSITSAGAGFPLSSGTNALRWVIGHPIVPATYYARVTLQFSSGALTSANGIALAGEASGSDAEGTNAGKDNSWRYHQPTSFNAFANVIDLKIIKDIIAVNGVASLNPANVPIGATLTYRIRYLNAGTLPQTGVVLSDVVPAQISTACASISNVAGSATAASNTCPAASSTITFNIPSVLKSGQGGAVTFDLKLAGSVGNTATNTAKLVTTQNSVGVTSSVATTLLALSDLTITKSHVGNFSLGQVGAQYTITASNVGQIATSGLVTVTDNLPADLTATAASGTGWTCTVGAPTVCTRNDVLAAGASYPPIILTVNVSNQAITPLINSVTVSGGGEANTANNTATDSTTISNVANLTITKNDAKITTVADDTNIYTITVTNNGPSVANGAVVTDPAVAGLTCSTVTCTFAGGASCPAAPTVAALQSSGLIIPTLPNSGNVTLTLTCSVSATGV